MMSKRAGRSIGAVSLLVVLCSISMATRAQAQWWTAAPADYEDCSERVEHSALSGHAKAAAQSNCESKFAGRRKHGGGYTYYDFMQERSFDIAGPNPTAAEQKMIDEQYAIYLGNQRRSIILAAFAKTQSDGASQAPVTDFRDPAPAAPAMREAAKAAPAAIPRPRPQQRAARTPDCAKEPLACGWSRLSSGLKDIKDALFGPSAPNKTKRS